VVKRGAVFIDNGYWVKTTLFSPTSPDWVVKNIVSWCPELKNVEQWMVYVYDAEYDLESVPFYESQLMIPRGIAKYHRRELQELRDRGFCVRVGGYVPRNENGLSRMQQKGVDSLIVIDAMDELHHFNTDTFVFFASDRDFVPVFKRILMGVDEGARAYMFFSSLTGKTGIETSVPELRVRDVQGAKWVQGGELRAKRGAK